MNLDTFTASVRQFIVDHNPALATVEIGRNTDLIDSRLIDSLIFVEFLLFLEDWFSRPVRVQSGDLSTFRSIDSIYRSFSAPEVQHVQ